jgi:cytochrome c biogenesis protein
LDKNETIPKQIWTFFASVRLTVYLLVLLAVTSIIGTVVLQNGSPQEYIRLYGPGLTNLIKVLQINDMYHAWWFLLLLLLLCINIVVCSVERLSKTWKIIFPDKITVNPGRFSSLKNKEQFTLSKDVGEAAAALEAVLAKKIGPVIRKQTDQGLVLYAEKGRWTRLGVYVVHASVILLLAGALIGALFGFKASLRLDEGSASDTVFAAKTRAPIKLPFSVRCNSFEVRFYDTGAPEEFKSNLTVIEDGQESFSSDILVNHPLRYRGINIFQSSYGTASPGKAVFAITDTQTKQTVSHTIKKGGSVSLPDDRGTFEFEGFIPHFDFRGHNLGEAFVGRISLKDQESFQVALPTKFPTFDRMRKGNFSVEVTSFKQAYYTGLQVTKDPGVWYVYAGFLFMILGCWVTFFISHQSYCLGFEKGQGGQTLVWLAGKSNRNPHGMTLKVKKLATQLKEI